MMVATVGCRTPPFDRSIQVSQQPSEQDHRRDKPPTRLAYSKKPAAGVAPAGAAAATASIDDSGQQLTSSLAAAGTSAADADGVVQDKELLEAFRDADPVIRDAARRRLAATKQTQIQSKPLPDLPTRAELDADPFAAEPDAVATADAPRQAAAEKSSPVVPASHSAQAEQAPAERPTAPAAAEPLLGPDSTTEQLAADEAKAARPSSAEEAKPSQPAADDAKAARLSSAEETKPSQPAADENPSSAASLERYSDQKLLAELARRWQTMPEDLDEPGQLRHHVRRRMLLLLDGRIDEAVEPIDSLGSSEQEYLRNQLLALWTAMDPQGHPVLQRRWSTALPHLRDATKHMAAATGTLEVGSLAFCTEVESYGRIKPFESTRFKAGQQVILYSEVDGFAAERLSNGYETQFQGSYEIFDHSGKRLYHKVLPADRQVCNNYRRDYFIAYRLHLPSQLAEGQYRMELTMEDLKGEKYGQASIDFEINGSVAKPHAGS
ncbi:hypothetical protein [Roseimaritima sediminicola]|uniref:hypothetical protein n=1 Tax=Roseimaritima sediminicola TaxID=2662066 RepID=UPI00129824F0|nr:hypothetical protein [Roseimaritima sediminicola]